MGSVRLTCVTYSLYGGADFGECLTTIDRIGAGSVDDWCREWLATADRIAAIAENCEQRKHLVSAREAYLRATTYYHVSCFLFLVFRLIRA